jgi:Nucleotidyl transferase AbiEii toxin, Type IV TA system
VTGSRRPTRATIEGRAYLDLRTLAHRQHRPIDELHQLYALEGFLARLAGSLHAEQLVLKGGMLLAAYDGRRPTRDLDMQALTLTGERDVVLDLVRSIAAIAMDDGLVFHADSGTAEIIREEDEHTGVRVNLTATLSSARLSLHVDVQRALAEVAAYRQIELAPLGDVLNGYAALAQARWATWRRKQRLDDRLPSSFLDVLGPVIAFADVPLTGHAGQSRWEPATRAWNAFLDNQGKR